MGALLLTVPAFGAGLVAGRLTCQLVAPEQSRAAKLAMAGAGCWRFTGPGRSMPGSPGDGPG